MEELRLKTDNLVLDKYKEFLQRQPKAVMESQESFRQKEEKTQLCALEKLDERRTSVGGKYMFRKALIVL